MGGVPYQSRVIRLYGMGKCTLLGIAYFWKMTSLCVMFLFVLVLLFIANLFVRFSVSDLCM